MMNVIKRDETIQPFDFKKIKTAVLKAFKSTSTVFSEFDILSKHKREIPETDENKQEITDIVRLLEELEEKKEEVLLEVEKFTTQLEPIFNKLLSSKESIHVDNIHDIIQRELIKKNKYDVVDSFIRWRKECEEKREANSDLIKEICKALNASDVQNQNANVDEASFGGRMGEATSKVTKKEALRTMRKQSRKNHENNEIYIHRLKIVAFTSDSKLKTA